MKFRVPREQIPWHPTVDADKCAGCKTCFDFCRNKVYEWDEENGKRLTGPTRGNPSRDFTHR